MTNKIIKTTTVTAAMMALVSTAIAGGITSTAYAGSQEMTSSSTSSSNDNNAANDITITNPTVANQNPTASINGHKFKAYKLADYTDPQLNKTGDAVIGYDLKQSDALKTETLAAIKAAAITNDKVAANLTNVLNADGTFKGEAENLTPIQFVGRYFYGTGADVYGNDHANNAQLRAFADYFTKHAIATLGDATEATGANGKVDFDFGDDQIGLYLIVEDTPASGDNTSNYKQTTQTVSRAMIAGTAFKVGDKYINKFIYNDDANNTTTLGEIKLKADAVTIDKETTGVNGKADSDDKLIAAGSTRSFTIKTNVPNYMNDYQDWKSSGGQTPYFKVFDRPSANLDAATNIKAYIDTNKDGQLSADEMKTPLTDGTDYTLTNPYTGTASNAWKLDLKMTNTDGSLNESQLKKFSDAHIVITYDAKVNTTQVDNSYNVATVSYSSDPYSTGNKISEGKENLYEADLKLEKVKFNDKATQLDGAQFKVYAGYTATGTPIKWAADGSDYFITGANSGATNTTDTLTVNKQTTLRQLAADTDATHGATYTFVETKAPAGYILGDKPVTFSVTVKPVFDNNGELTSVSYSLNGGNYNNFLDLGTLSTANGKNTQTVNANLDADATTRIVGGEITVENTTNIKDFAKTGGQIMSYIAAAAGLAVAGAFIAMIARRNRNKA